MVESQKDRKGRSNSKRSGFTRESKAVKSKRWWDNQDSGRNEISRGKNIKRRGVKRS